MNKLLYQNVSVLWQWWGLLNILSPKKHTKEEAVLMDDSIVIEKYTEPDGPRTLHSICSSVIITNYKKAGSITLLSFFFKHLTKAMWRIILKRNKDKWGKLATTGCQG